MTEEDLIGVSDIAESYGVAKNSAWRWTQRDDFPTPAVHVRIGRFWRRADVEKWGETHLPLRRGRPPKSMRRD